MTMSELVNLRLSGRFHHATYRNQGTLWEGLWIYEKTDDAIGYIPAGSFCKDSPDLKAAENYVKDTGISFGSFR